MYRTLAEGGNTPIIISEDNNGKNDSTFGGGGVFIILLFVIIIAVVMIPFLLRRESVVERGSTFADMLPAMMVMQTATANTAKQTTVDVNSYNTGANGCGIGPTNFQLYQQGVETNNNVYVQSCQTREKIDDDGQSTRDLINTNRMHDLELALAERNATIISLNTQLTSERQYSSLTAQSTANYNSLQMQISALAATTPKNPVPAVCVSPYGTYRSFDGCGA